MEKNKLFKVRFYKDKQGRQPALEYIRELSEKSDKDSRINLNKINNYIEALKQYGTRIGKPFVKYLDKGIWELRPLGNRIFFVVWVDETFVLLHAYEKKSQKTPEKELKRALQEYKELLERGLDNDK